MLDHEADAQFDLIVIGSGPAGEKGAAQAAYFGKSVALIERHEVSGGAAANTGTLPSKTLRESALHLTGFNNRDLSALQLAIPPHIRARDFLRRAGEVMVSERRRVDHNLERHGIRVIRADGRLIDPHSVEVTYPDGSTSRLEGEVILIATGSSPFHPDFVPAGHATIYDSDTILHLDHMPKVLAIVGGGVIGCEYACMFAALGVTVHLVEGRDVLLGFMDEAVSAILSEAMRDLGVRLHLKDGVVQMAPGHPHRIDLRSGDSISADAILVATGRTPNTRQLGLKAAGVETDERGHIKVGDRYRTSVANIYAAGDVIGFPALASTSMEQARVAIVDAFELRYKTELAHVLPYGVYTIPECSMAGDTEQSLRVRGIDYVSGVARYAENARGEIIGEERGILKLLFAPGDMKLLGVHIIGEQACELVHVGLGALLMDATADLFIQTCFNYPTLSETYKYATYDALQARENQRN